MTVGDGPWNFSDSHLRKAVEAWQQAEHPSVERVGSFYDWCFAVAESGPPETQTFLIPGDVDGYVSLVESAGVTVT